MFLGAFRSKHLQAKFRLFLVCFVLLCFVLFSLALFRCILFCFVLLCYFMLCFALLLYDMFRYTVLCYVSFRFPFVLLRFRQVYTVSSVLCVACSLVLHCITQTLLDRILQKT